MKAVLVTGGAGFIGSHTVVALAESGYRPIIVDNFSNSKKSVIGRLEKIIGQPVTYTEQDYQDIAKLRDLIQRESVESIIHFAAYKAVGESVAKPLVYYQNNVAGFIALLDGIQDLPVKHVVFSSSCTVYGEPDKLPVDESAPFKPAESPYGATKQMCETILRDSTKISENMNSIALRYFNPIGAHASSLIGELPRGVPNNLVPFITQTAAGLRDELTVHGNDYDTPDGTCIRDYIHVVDLAKAHVKALAYLQEQPPAATNAVNIGTGTGSSVMEVIKTFEEVSGQKLRYTVGPRRSGDVVSTYARADKAAEILGWKTEKSLADGLRDAWHWQQSLKN